MDDYSYSWCLSANKYAPAAEAKRIFTREECLNELKCLAALVGHMETPISKVNNLSTLKRILFIFSTVLDLEIVDQIAIDEMYRYIVKCVRDIKYMPLGDDKNENIIYIWKDILSFFLKMNFNSRDLDILNAIYADDLHRVSLKCLAENIVRKC